MSDDKNRIIAISDALDEAASKINILRNIAWPNEVEQEFFKNKAQKLPTVEYKPFDPEPALDELKKARKLLGVNDVIDKWATRIADKLESSALLLSSRGTQDFFRHSKNMYGCPKDVLPDGESTALDLAQHFGELFENVIQFAEFYPNERVRIGVYSEVEPKADKRHQCAAVQSKRVRFGNFCIKWCGFYV